MVRHTPLLETTNKPQTDFGFGNVEKLRPLLFQSEKFRCPASLGKKEEEVKIIVFRLLRRFRKCSQRFGEQCWRFSPLLNK